MGVVGHTGPEVDWQPQCGNGGARTQNLSVNRVSDRHKAVRTSALIPRGPNMRNGGSESSPVASRKPIVASKPGAAGLSHRRS